MARGAFNLEVSKKLEGKKLTMMNNHGGMIFLFIIGVNVNILDIVLGRGYTLD